MCCHQFINLEYCIVCSKCGRSENRLVLDSFNLNSSPMVKNYSRTLRFRTKIDRMLTGHPKPLPTDPVWDFLSTCKEMDCPCDVRAALKGSKLVNKHYDSIKVLCDCFSNFRIPYEDTRELHAYMLRNFNLLHSTWNFSAHQKFFSYTWLIRIFLTAIDSPYIAYLKPPTSRKRHNRYLRLFEELLPKSQCLCRRISNHVLKEIHFLNV